MYKNSYKDMTRGTRRHYTKLKQDKYFRRGWRMKPAEIPTWEWRGRAWPYSPKQRGNNGGRCGCWSETAKCGRSCVAACDHCRRFVRQRAGELGLDDSWGLLNMETKPNRLVMDTEQTLSVLCKVTGSYGLYLHVYNDDKLSVQEWWEDIGLAMPFLSPEESEKFTMGDTLCLLFESEKEAWETFDLCVLKGPSDSNEYCGPIRVYALLIDSEGEPVTENC